jgi:hypothetical protein
MTPGEQLQEFEGVYVAHWEIARFEVTVGRSFLGRQAIEKWYPRFPHDFELPDSPGFDRGPGRKYTMRVRGRLGPKGRFGHLGICSRELDVTEVLSCDRVADPQVTFGDAD